MGGSEHDILSLYTGKQRGVSEAGGRRTRSHIYASVGFSWKKQFQALFSFSLGFNIFSRDYRSEDIFG